MKIKWEWERDRLDKLNKARERYATESRIRLSTTVRSSFRVRHPPAPLRPSARLRPQCVLHAAVCSAGRER
jgi:hypothetical protein